MPCPLQQSASGGGTRFPDDVLVSHKLFFHLDPEHYAPDFTRSVVTFSTLAPNGGRMITVLVENDSCVDWGTWPDGKYFGAACNWIAEPLFWINEGDR